MSKGHWLLIIVIAFLLSFAYCNNTANAEEKFPLIWQAWSAPNSSGDVVKRLHDPEAGVNCYVITSPGKIWTSGGPTYKINGESVNPAIDCVKVR